MFCKHSFTTKTLWTTFAKVFFVFIFRFTKHKSVEIFNVQMMQFIIINYKQQIHRGFKCLIWNVNWKNKLVLVTKHINTNTFLFLNLAKKFFLHRIFNFIIIKIISQFFILFCNSIWMYFCRINMPNMTP